MTVKTCFHDVTMCFEVLKSSVKEKMELDLSYTRTADAWIPS